MPCSIRGRAFSFLPALPATRCQHDFKVLFTAFRLNRYRISPAGKTRVVGGLGRSSAGQRRTHRSRAPGAPGRLRPVNTAGWQGPAPAQAVECRVKPYTLAALEGQTGKPDTASGQRQPDTGSQCRQQPAPKPADQEQPEARSRTEGRRTFGRRQPVKRQQPARGRSREPEDSSSALLSSPAAFLQQPACGIVAEPDRNSRGIVVTPA